MDNFHSNCVGSGFAATSSYGFLQNVTDTICELKFVMASFEMFPGFTLCYQAKLDKIPNVGGFFLLFY